MSELPQIVEIKCTGALNLKIDDLHDFQGNLKELSEKNYAKLKHQMLELGFSEPVSVWKHKDKWWLLNGHQRVRTLKKMGDEGIVIPKIPASQVQAKNIKEAKLKVLALTSQYGQMTGEGLYEFLNEASLTLEDIKNDFRFPEIDLEAFGAEFYHDLNLAGFEADGLNEPVNEALDFLGFSKDQMIEIVKDEILKYDISAFPRSVMTANLAAAEFNEICRGRDTGYWLSSLFNPHRLEVKCAGKGSLYAAFRDKKENFAKRGAILLVENTRGKVHPHAFVKYAGLGWAGTQLATDFPPALARQIYNDYCPADAQILDPCHGWGGRFIGCMATLKKHHYTGVDPSLKTHQGLLKLQLFLSHAEGVNASATFHNQPFEAFSAKENSFDFAFTSPPYFDTEDYAPDENTQASNTYASLAAFNEGFLQALIANTMKALRPHGKLLLNVGNRKYDLSSAIAEICKKLKLKCETISKYSVCESRSNVLKEEQVLSEAFLEISR